MHKISIEALARKQLKEAVAAPSARAADTVFGGHEKFCGRPSSGYVRVLSSESATITMNPRFMSYKGVSNSGRAMRPG